MHFDVPDPRYTHSVHSRALLVLAVRLSIGFVVVLWLIHLMNWGLDLDPRPFGVRPREWLGLIGIGAAPLVHGDFGHLVANSVPLLVLGAVMLFLYPHSTLRVLPAVYLGPGLLVWMFGRDSVHFGASGLVYGLVSYVFVAGLLRRDRRAIAASLLVVFMYGSLAWGVLPIQPGVSWETHLSAAVIGVLMALLLRSSTSRRASAMRGRTRRRVTTKATCGHRHSAMQMARRTRRFPGRSPPLDRGSDA
jgi:membrane associated rhomboid family serine protease